MHTCMHAYTVHTYMTFGTFGPTQSSWSAKDDLCSLSSGRKDQCEWVARYYAKIPDDRSPEKKLQQKTRTSTAKTFGSSHAAFLNSLKWIWQKHLLICSSATMPAHVKKALEDCSCHSKKPVGKIEMGACAEAMLRLESGLGYHPPRSQLAISKSSKAAPPTRTGVETTTPRSNQEQDSTSSSSTSSTTTSSEATATKSTKVLGQPFLEGLPAAPPGLCRAPCPLSGGKTQEDFLANFNEVRIPGDGRCLFTATAVGKVMWTQSEIPSAERMKGYSAKNRLALLDWLKQKLAAHACFPEGGPPLAVSLQAATGLSADAYLQALEAGKVWGGWLEASIMATRWNCRMRIHYQENSQLQCVEFGAEKSTRWIQMRWTGDHYNLLLKKERWRSQLL